ncbi:YraN family protein [bacterium]|nr:YraN family protein [bacterium]
MRTSPARGRWAEEEAARHLTRQPGWRLLDHNVRLAGGEIDLVLQDGQQVVFVEVKARRAGNAAEAVTADKRRRIARAAALWVARHGMPRAGCRFDVVTVQGRGSRALVQHFPSAFDAPDRWGV